MTSEGGQSTPDAEAAVALAGFAQTASTVSLPSNTASRRSWDQEHAAAAPPMDNGAAQPPATAPAIDPKYHAVVAAATAPTHPQRQPAVASAARPAYPYYHLPPHYSHYPPPHYPHPSHHAPHVPASAAPVATPAPAIVTHAAPAPAHHTTIHASATPASVSHMASRQPYAEAQFQPRPQPQVQPQQVAVEKPTAFLMSMSSIGFGVSQTCSVDATEAAVRAVQDSMARSAVRVPPSDAVRSQLTIHVKLGVPAKPTGEPMHVDTSRLSLFLPQSVPLVGVEIVVGGLLIDHKEADGAPLAESTATPIPNPHICTAVASVTLQQGKSNPTTSSQQTAEPVLQQSTARAAPVQTTNGRPPEPTHAVAPATAAPTNSPWSQLHSPPLPPHPPQHHRSVSQPLPAAYQHPPAAAPPHRASTTTTHPGQGPSQGQGYVHRSNSMEVLAQISGELRERQYGLVNIAPAPPTSNTKTAASSDTQNGEDNSTYNYKKLSPGMTPKNNKRLFVRHEYKDYAREKPLPEEMFLVHSDSRTPNAAFPLKLHETLAQIELDGLGHILGWMPHGRSFKIHQQQEFVDVVLPRYFVMTKKSSFLRQLNLYNFNRISVGPDSGSYYHEKFLKGLKFLCRRMTRQKVNGNGIRAAGNPEEEPQLNNYPPCPPKSVDYGSDDDGDESAEQLGSAPLPALDEGSADTNQPAKQDSNGGNNGSVRRTSSVSRTDGPGHNNSFPFKLHRLLDKIESEGTNLKDIISWQPHGRSFLVHDVDRFVSEIMNGKVFNQSKYSSFQRQLHMYNFQRITFGRDKGAYHHDKFQRGRPDLCVSMVRTRVNGKGCRRPGDPDNEPDFYEMEHAPTIGPGGVLIELPTGNSQEDDDDMDDNEESEMQIVDNGETSAVAV
ncbi:shock factor protein 4 [Seminavis robusta]|uniref:Shock factor protein 4 n=1 Tax=Seminavis robusta TaxID=568900 RepID=A0A9N8EA82_9STRA|nr:shock factor protein 4 [Seminavis robusta]|eukprot:Sro852_g211060.1 shock factor protein 4 (891) ;mRNA; r:37402-40492